MAMQIKRRNTGSSGAPSSLKSGQLAWNNPDKKLFLGTGDDGSGNATSIDEVGGEGSVVMLTGNQTVGGVKTFSSFPVTPSSEPSSDYQVANKKYVDDAVIEAGAGDMLAAVYDPNGVEADAFDMDNMVEGDDTKIMTAAERTKLGGIEASADVTDAGNVGAAIHGSSSKSTPTGADALALINSEASNILAKLTLTNLVAFLQSALSFLTASGPATLTNKTFDANGTGNAISNLEVDDFAASVVDTDGSLAANSDSRLATQKAVKTYADTKLTAAGTATLTNKTFDANGAGNSISNLEVADFAPNVVDNDGTLAANSSSRLPSQQAVKTYVDSKIVNAGKRQVVRVATTASITIATALNDGDTIDGVELDDGDLVLVKNQSSPEQNGVYVVGTTPARYGEFDAWEDFPGATFIVQEGTANADTMWLCTSNAGGTIDTTAIAFSQATITGELLAAQNLADLANAGDARDNLGLGSLATQDADDVAITGGTISGADIDDGTY